MIKFKVYFQKWIFNEKQGIQKFKSAIFAILLGLSIGAILIMFKKTNPISIYRYLFEIPFSKLFRIQTIFLISTFILLSVGLGVGFYAGLFNIGGVGQMLFSFFVCYLLIHYKVVPNNAITKYLLIFVSIICGAFLGFIIGFLKAYFNIHEVVSSIFLNWIIFYIVIYVGKEIITKNNSFDLPELKNDNNYYFFTNNEYLLVILLSILIALIIWTLLKFTTIGYRIKVMGLNKEAARFNGINVTKTTIDTFIISSSLCGLAGYFFYIISKNGNFLIVDAKLPTEAFEAISISLLSFNSPISAIFISFFYSFLIIGAENITIPNISSDLIRIIVSLILFFSALVTYFVKFKFLNNIYYRIRYYYLDKKTLFLVIKKNSQIKEFFDSEFSILKNNIFKLKNNKQSKNNIDNLYNNFWKIFIDYKNNQINEINNLIKSKVQKVGA